MKKTTRNITLGEQDSTLEKQKQARWNPLGKGPVKKVCPLGIMTKSLEKEYHHVPFFHIMPPLEHIRLQDKEPGARLDIREVFRNVPCTALSETVIVIAEKEIGVREDPPGSNNGARVSEYLKSMGLDGGYPWCAAFVYWCFEQAAAELNFTNPLVRTGASMKHWQKTAGIKTVTLVAVKNPLLIKPGAVFIISRGGGKGHTGIVVGVRDEYILSIEGNSNGQGSAEGGGVYEVWRKIESVNVGFIEYGAGMEE